MLMALKNAKKIKDKREEEDREDIDHKDGSSGSAQVPKNISSSNLSLPMKISENKISKIQSFGKQAAAFATMAIAFGKRKPPKLLACMTKASLETVRNKALFAIDFLDDKAVRRKRLPLYDCLLLELRESGYVESADYLQDLIYDNAQLIAEDDIGIIVDIRKRDDYLAEITDGLKQAEKEKEKGDSMLLIRAHNTCNNMQRIGPPSLRTKHMHKMHRNEPTPAITTLNTCFASLRGIIRRRYFSSYQYGVYSSLTQVLTASTQALLKCLSRRRTGDIKRESLHILKMAMTYAERGKSIIWLAEKFYLVSIAIASTYLVDGGRQKAVCKYHYAKFLVDKFPQADPEESYQIMTEVRDISNGRTWLLYEKDPNDEDDTDGNTELPMITVFVASAIQLHRLLLCKLRAIRASDPNQAERLARLAERRARDAQDMVKQAEAIIEIGVSQLQLKNFNNALNTFQKALNIYTEINDIKGICEAKMHLSAVLQRLGDHQNAAVMLTEMGSLAMEHGLRKHLGRALHLLGELHLRRGRPELGTEHLAEAFSCFMGFSFQEAANIKSLDDRAKEDEEGEGIYKPPYTDVSEEEAEQSRLMMAISAGQELMASFFNEIRNAGECNISRHKIIEWKLSKSGWWYDHDRHKLFTCPCPEHNRSPIDVIRLQRQAMEQETVQMKQEASQPSGLFRTNTVEDIRTLRSSFQKIRSQLEVDRGREEADNDEKEVKVIEEKCESEQG